MKKLNNKSGISLIVLVITIIVMIILAAAIILSLQSSGIIGRANEAKTKTDIANAKQVVAMAKAEWELMTAAEQLQKGSFKAYAETKLKKAGYEVGIGEEKYEVTEEGKIYTYPEIPKGFIASELIGEKTVSGGLVIYELNEGETSISASEWNDKTGGDANILDVQEERNQFVWVPVDNISDFRRDAWDMEESLFNDTYFELFTQEYNGVKLSLNNDLTGEHAEYLAIRKSVEKYGGFYIGRYEAGSLAERTDKSNYTTQMVVQKNKYVYNYVPWGASMINVDDDVTHLNLNQGKGAVYLSRNLYKDSKSVVSTLCYGSQWDATLKFIATKDKNYITDATGKGHYCYVEDWEPITETEAPILTGSNENYSLNNIYDMAGNVEEWTMEVIYSSNKYLRITRGADYCWYGSIAPAPSRVEVGTPNVAEQAYGFRVALYLK